MMMMFVARVVLMFNRIIVLFLPKVGAALKNFPEQKKKEEFWFHVHKKRGTKLREPAEPHPMFTPVINRRFFIRPPQRKSPLAI